MSWLEVNRIKDKLYILDNIPFVKKRVDYHMREVIYGASIALLLKVLGAGLVFGFNVLLARRLGAEGAGVYYLSLTVITIATVFGRMGLDKSLLRFTATNADTEDWVAVKGVYRKGMMLAMAASFMSTLVMFTVASFLAETVFSKPELAIPLRWMTLSIVPFTLLILHSEMLKGLKRIRDSQLIQGVGVPALSLGGLYLLGQHWGVNGAVCVYTLATVVTAFVGFWLWRKATPQLWGTSGHFETKKLLSSSIPLFWTTLMNLAMNWTPLFMLGIWGTNAEVGIFSVATRTVWFISFFLIAVNSIAAPKFAALYKQGDMEAIGSTARGSSKILTLTAFPIFLLFVLAPKWVMGIFGMNFVEGSAALAILAIGQFVNAATGSVGILLMMSGNEHVARKDAMISSGMNLVLGLLLIPPFGLIGAALTTSISLIILNILFLVSVSKKLGIQALWCLKLNKHLFI